MKHILDKSIHEHHRHEQYNRLIAKNQFIVLQPRKPTHLEVGKEKRQLMTRYPAHDNQQWDDKRRDLDRASDRDGDGEFHLIFHGHPDGSDVFGCICLCKEMR